ncbi:MAG: transporter, family, proline/betaine transporter [Nocardioidaceae bacterium]|nr:transporter, family, proline/betaine transporter [Nocardioidaceae bacterium]
MRTYRRRELVSACVANAIEWYDFAVFGAVASVLVVVLLPPQPAPAGLVTLFAVFASSFLTRPVGALLIGRRADRLGRRHALAAMILLMTGATAAMALLPSWSAVGVLAPLCLLALRLTQGFASGGEISSSIPFLLESAPRQRWGLYSGWHTATIASGLASGIAVAGLLSATLSTEALRSWGWRVAFLLALPLGVVGLYVRLRLNDTPGFEASTASREAPGLRDVWRLHGSTIRTGFVLVSVLSAAFNMWFIFLPSHLAEEGTHSLAVALSCAAGGLLAAAMAAPALGLWSDRLGRRPLLIIAGSCLCLLALPLYGLANQRPWWALLLADVGMGVILGGLVIGAYLAERLPVGVRATGIGLSFGLATAVVGGTAALVGSVLARAGWSAGIPVYLVVLAGSGLIATVRAPVALPDHQTTVPAR